MTTVRAAAVLLNSQQAKRNTAYGQINPLYLSTIYRILARAPLDPDIPEDAIVTRADLVVRPIAALKGSRAFRVYRNTSSFSDRTTYNTRPTLDGAYAEFTVGATPANAPIRFDVLEHVQEFVAGAETNYGWTVVSDAEAHERYGGKAASGAWPYLDYAYVIPGEPPTSLSPAGVVPIGKPTLQFSLPPQTSRFEVRIDAGGDFANAGWSSGEVARDVGLLDLADTDYPGLSNGEATQFAVRAYTPYGWSDFSLSAEFIRHDRPAASITSPGDAAGDTTPPVVWDTDDQSAFRTVLWDVTADRIAADSGMVATATVRQWTPPDRSGVPVGRQARYELSLWDSRTDRVASPGHPVEQILTRSFEVTPSGDAPPPGSLTITTPGSVPRAELEWTQGETQPDEWAIFRSGDLVAKVPGNVLTYTDYGIRRYRHQAYEVRAVSDGAISRRAATAGTRLNRGGIWLVDPDTGEGALLIDAESGEISMPEQAATHEVIGAPAVRRRIGVVPPAGTAAGMVQTTAERRAEMTLETLGRFKRHDSGKLYRLHLGDWNVPVTVGDITWRPTPMTNEAQHAYLASFAWAQTADELPWGSA